ncbi:TerD family protein [Streptomyces litchfieldiae]|uniref:TerD family protein n=1 Tax=Streptomyces litchfieldiae TaxID=3075543 RepID=A0ABU2MR55_9ACTN|nr:TerD family protein [Streptomyces sp. DSM 44938]MDT0343574.1 TerD family protein [Streptomyces sp. DSM 44938]
MAANGGELSKGGNRALAGDRVSVEVTTSAGIDVSALLLTSEGKVRGDSDLVFFNHPEQDGVRVDGRSVHVDLARVPAEVASVACVASIDVAEPGAAFDAGSTPRVTVSCEGTDLTFAPPPLTGGETVLLLVEFYRRADAWKVRALGQGYATGLAGLATDFGIVVDDAEEEPAVAAMPEAAVPSAPPAGALGKIELTKSGAATISLNKGDPELVVTAALEWDGGSRGDDAADLDLYALFVPAHAVRPPLTGKERKAADAASQETPKAGAVYWNNLGDLRQAPHLMLDGDARVPGREVVRIQRPDQHGFVLICAYSAVENGTGSFRSFGAKAVVSDGRGSTVTVPLYSDNDNAYWVAIALADFTVPEGVRISQVEKYSKRHSENRPMLYADGVFEMDRGPVEFKDWD